MSEWIKVDLILFLAGKREKYVTAENFRRFPSTQNVLNRIFATSKTVPAVFLSKHTTPRNLLWRLMEPCKSKGLCLTPVRNSELGKVEPTHICADHLVDCGVVCCAEVYSYWEVQSNSSSSCGAENTCLWLPSTQHCRSLQREFPCT